MRQGRGGAALAFLGVVTVLGVLTVPLVLALTSPPIVQDLLARAAAVILLLFLVALVARYLIFLWLGYLHLLENSALEHAEQGADFTPPISIIVPAYNEGAVIESAVRSLLQQDYPQFEILVIDDGSTDDTLARAAPFESTWGGATVRVFSKRNAGKAQALNHGIAVASHAYVLNVDGDSRLPPGTLRLAVKHFRDPSVAAVAGNVKVVNRGTLWTRLQALEYIEGLNMARRAQGFVRAVNIIPGPVGLFRRDVLLELGGYDSDTFAEDADLTLKLLAAGWRVMYEDGAIAYTEAPERLQDLIKQRYRWTRGILQALKKHRRVLIAPRTFVIWLSVCVMIFESIVWPMLNVLGTVFFLMAALAFGGNSYLIVWWVLLTLLDIAAALHTLVMEGEDLRLLPYAIIYRFVFVLLIDFSKLFATVEEFLDIEMTWGKLERLGRI